MPAHLQCPHAITMGVQQHDAVSLSHTLKDNRGGFETRPYGDSSKQATSVEWKSARKNS